MHDVIFGPSFRIDGYTHGLKSADGGRRALSSHLLGTAAHLQTWGAPDYVVVAGLVHSIYGRAAFGDVAVISKDDTEVGGLGGLLTARIGAKSAALVDIFSALTSVQTLFDGSPCSGPRDGGDSSSVFQIQVHPRGRTGEFMLNAAETREIDREMLEGLVMLVWASAAEQRRSLGIADGGDDGMQLEMLSHCANAALLPPGALDALLKLFAPPTPMQPPAGQCGFKGNSCFQKQQLSYIEGMLEDTGTGALDAAACCPPSLPTCAIY